MPEENNSTLSDIKKAMLLRRILIYILIGIVILFPTILAVINVIYVDSGTTIMSERATEVAIYDEDGTELHREHTSEGLSGEGSLISIFNTMYYALEEASDIPAEAMEVQPVKAEITFSKATHTFTCYFPFTEGFAYCTDQDGKNYKIRTSDSERFLSSEFAEILYSEATPPALLTGDGEQIISTSQDWYYQNIEGTYMPAMNIKNAAAGLGYAMTGGVSFEFDTPPESATVRVIEDGVTVFDGSIGALDMLTLKSSSSVAVIINASWSKIDGRPFYGDVTYDFGISVYNRAEFSISSSALAHGEFLILTATNITDTSKIKFVSDTKDFIPTLLTHKNTAYMLIPHAVIPNDADVFEFTVSYGVATADFKIANSSYLSEEEHFEAYDNMLALDMTLPESVVSGPEYLFFSGKIDKPSDAHFSKTLGYSDAFEYDSNTLHSFFTEYEALSPDSEIRALGGGKVVSVGESGAMGKYAVIDMGMDLKIWYCNLSDVDVRVGSYVVKGDIIGNSGKLLDGKREGFTLVLSCKDALFDIEKILY